MRKLAMLCMAAAMTGAVSAQTTKTIELNLDQAVAIALDENPTIRIADIEIEKQRYALRETRGGLLPDLSVSGGYTRYIMHQVMGGSIKVTGDNNFNAAANMTLPLVAPGLYAMINLSREQIVQSVEAARGSRITLVNEVKKSFYNVLLAQQSMEVLKRSESSISETVDNTRAMYENGLVAEFDLITAEVQLSNIRPNILQTEMAIDISKMMLKMYLGLGEDVEIELKGTLADYRNAMTEMFTDDLSGNSDLRLLDIQRNLLGLQLKAQRTSRMPTLGAVANLSFSGTDLAPMDFSSSLSGFTDLLKPLYEAHGLPFPDLGGGTTSNYRYNWQHPFYVGAQLSIPIFSGNSKINRERQIRASISQMNMQRNYAEDGIRLQLNTAVNNILTTREKMLANEKTVVSARKAFDIAGTRYSAGAGTMLELNSAEVNLTQANLNLTQAICDYLSAQADYERIIGKEE